MVSKRTVQRRRNSKRQKRRSLKRKNVKSRKVMRGGGFKKTDVDPIEVKVFYVDKTNQTNIQDTSVYGKLYVNPKEKDNVAVFPFLDLFKKGTTTEPVSYEKIRFNKTLGKEGVNYVPTIILNYYLGEDNTPRILSYVSAENTHPLTALL